jgi:cobalamin biosynthesis Mg chelatase CobN
MFTSVVALAAIAGSIVSAAPVAQRDQPAEWATGYLEDYNTYHARYLALDCQDQHDTTFFDDCCHPLLATESLSSRPSYCTPNATESSSAAAVVAETSAPVAGSTASATTTDSAAADVATEYAQAAASSSASPAAAATSSSAAVDNNVAYAPAQSSTKAQATTTSSAAPAASSSASSGGSGSSGTVETGGYATFFYQGGQAGACGTVHSDSDLVIAIDIAWYGNTGSESSYCGKSITVQNTQNGKEVTAVVADVCPTCANGNSLDLSVGAFTAIATEAEGQVPINWWFN